MRESRRALSVLLVLSITFSWIIAGGNESLVKLLGICVSAYDISFEDTAYWPVPSSTKMSRGFYYTNDNNDKNDHKGIDIKGSSGAVIIASKSGYVVDAKPTACSHDGNNGEDHNCSGTPMGSYGNYVEIKNDDGTTSRYGHMKYNSICVSVDQHVSAGDKIGLMGSTGASTGTHLHFEIYKGDYRSRWDQNINPSKATVNRLGITGNYIIGEREYYSYSLTPPITAPPSEANLSINKADYSIGESFSLYSSSDQICSYFISIYDADSNELILDGYSSGVFTTSFNRAGHYAAHMSAFNEKGSVDSNWVEFYYYGDKPTHAELSVNRSEATVGESLVFSTWTDAYYVRIYISIFNNAGDCVYEGFVPYTFSYTPQIAGTYSAHISAYTVNGTAESNWVDVVVRDSDSVDINAPTMASLSINHSEFNIGESFSLYCSSDQSCSFYLSIYDADTNEFILGDYTSGIFSTSFNRAGHYAAHMSAFNEKGSIDSNWVDFYYFGGSPTRAELSVDKSEIQLNENITFSTWTDSYYVRIYMSIYDKDGHCVFGSFVPYSFDYTPLKPGEYSAYISAYTPNGTVDSNWVSFNVVSNTLIVSGDANGDTIIDLKDVVVIARYLAGGWDVTVDLAAADVNHDGEVNLKDAVILRRYLAGGWGIELK